MITQLASASIWSEDLNNLLPRPILRQHLEVSRWRSRSALSAGASSACVATAAPLSAGSRSLCCSQGETQRNANQHNYESYDFAISHVHLDSNFIQFLMHQRLNSQTKT